MTKPSMIFVFGSNTSGRHGKGAALTALKYHGAIHGQAEGLMGGSYALPTCDGQFKKLPLITVDGHVMEFLRFASQNPTMGFQVTRVGCGLAGYKDEDMASLFHVAPKENCFFDTKWRPFLGNEFEYWGTF